MIQHTHQRSVIFIILVLMIQYTTAIPSEKFIPVLQSDKFKINFMGSVSQTEDIIYNESFLKNLWNVITGSDDQQLIKPFAISMGTKGSIYVLDQAACKIQLYNTRMNSSSTFYLPKLTSLVDMTVLADSSIIFSDSRQGKVFILRTGEEKPSLFITDRTLNQPTGLVYNAKYDEIWISETGSHAISIFDGQGIFKRQLGERGVSEGQFNFPTFLAINKNQSIYVVDAINHRIQIFDSSGNFISTFSQPGDGSGDMARPKGIACDMYGHVYVVDGLFHTVQIFDQNGNYLDHFGEQGQSPGEFWMPAGIYIDSDNKIYVADTYNSRIQIFQLEVAN